MPSQKAAKAPTARVNGHYQPAASPVQLLRFNPENAENEQYAGLQIHARMKVPMGVYFQAAAPVASGDPDYWDKVTHRYRDFGTAVLVSWNLTYPDDHPKAGEEIPCTGEGYMELELDMATAIRNAWFYTLNNPEDAGPLGSPSNSGAQ